MPHVLKVMSSRLKSFSPLLLFLNSSQLVHLFLQCTGQNLTHKDYALLYNITLLRTQCKDTVYFSSLYGLQKKKKKNLSKHLENIIPNVSSPQNLKANEKGILEWEILGYISNTCPIQPTYNNCF